MTGHFYNTADFDPSTAVYPINAGGPAIFFENMMSMEISRGRIISVHDSQPIR